MKRKIYLLCVVITTISLFSSPTFALDPMRPPTAGLKTGQFRAGFDYSYGEADLEESALGISATLKDVESNRFCANLGYGLTDDWEAYLRLGAANGEQEEFDGDYGFAYGFGIKLTFAKDNALSWGALFQMGWSKTEDTLTYDLSAFGLGTITTDIEADWYEIQIAVGPTYEMQGWRIYGGPFLHFLEGDIDYKAFGISTDIEQESEFGGYIGTQIDLAENSSCYVEYQLTGDAWAIGTGISWTF